jgi:hypothetical protein
MDNKQKEAEAKENDHSRCRDKAERDEGEQGCDIGLRCPDPLSRGIGERNRCFGGSWTRVLGTLRGMSCRISSLNNCFPRIRRCTSRSPFQSTHPRIQAANDDRKAPALVIKGCLARLGSGWRPSSRGARSGRSPERMNSRRLRRPDLPAWGLCGDDAGAYRARNRIAQSYRHRCVKPHLPKV